jgi:Holliday junction resolvase RusA-like endonuclease
MYEPLDLRFFVPGDPVAKGNHNAFPIKRGDCTDCTPDARCKRSNCFNGIIVGTVITDDAGKALEAWQGMVRTCAIAARDAARMRPVEKPGALEISLVFLRHRPDSHYTGKGALSSEGLRFAMPTTKPDWDKLSRPIGDAMVDNVKRGIAGALADDDAQITVAQAAKCYTDRKSGVIIRARHITRVPDWVLAELVAAGFPAPAMQGALAL